MFFLKATNSFLATGENIRRPATCDGKLVYEGEFGIVIGKTYANVSEEDVAAKFSAVLASYSCINDVTAVELLQAEASFDQWTRGQSFVTLGVFGPVMASGLALNGLVVGTVLNGYERQNYPVGEIIIWPHRIASLLSRDKTLDPGDVVCCNTSIGLGSLKELKNTIDTTIEGIGILINVFDNGGMCGTDN